ncbi:uncharacterized protein LOC115014833 isoform X2 [Cottoperca gobio]|uniref:Uncharacterized protein LOC115014833 isoform X2 n=1 Tax=Cottoperca gobio TaxID=56716 RepID=A0A6J2QIK6_COTGO|nr:uncharacterized protein LOC115014833 isoform X2 [Cottoperca gobio]
MEAVVGLLVMILGVSHGVATHCDGRQDGVQCFGPLGGTVVVQLMDSDSEISRYQLFYNNKTTLIRVGNNVIITNNIQNGSSFTPSDKTLTLNNLSRNDGGEYKLQTFDNDGKKSGERTLQLTIQAPVSSVLLDSECLSQGEKRVSCSSEGGESPQYSWTLDGHKLTDAELLSANTETNSITLKQHVSGLLLCSVSNDVSSVTTEEKISNCGFIYINCTLNVTQISQWVFAANNTLCIEPTTAPTPTTEASTAGKDTDTTVSINPCTNITTSNQNETKDEPWYIYHLAKVAGVLSALVLLLVIGVAVIYTQKKKQSNKPKEEDEQELTYAVVTIKQRQASQMQQRAEDTEVEYGQVKFSERPRQTVEPAVDNCVCAKVHKGH